MTQTSSSSKRPRAETTADDIRAECPFTVRVLDPREKELKTKSKKRRKRGHNSSGGNHPDDDDGNRRILQQCAPFEPKGEFTTHSNMDVHYVVEPAKQWADMTRYNSFVLNGVKYYCEGFIYVANESSLERQRSGAATGAAAAGATGAAGAAGAGDAGAQNISPRRRSEDDWVARILEIRASDEHHVYARVFWMYWPDELPHGTHYGKRQVQARQPYHGSSELIASNHMDVINVVSVTSMAQVNHLNEDKDDDVQSALYWRQALDVRSMELSSIETVCDCNQPANPDKMLVGCGDDNCAKWIHEECLKHYALMRVYERLGHDKPHIAVKPALADVVKSETGTDDVKEPLSPRESGGAASAQHSIDVKADTVEVQGASEDETDKVASAGARPNGHSGDGTEAKDVAVRSKAKDDAVAGPSGTPPLKREVTPSESEAGGLQSAKKGASNGLATPTPAASASRARKSPAGAGVAMASGGGKKAAGRAFPTLQSFGHKKKPYDKLFEASLLLTPLDSTAPTMIEIRDLRRKVEGGEKEWLEPAECPVCGSAIR
ncbi:hypothetical protein HMPREF1624_03195 [Sporothrix schenckii ATCC 58251]|uniref:BAH domain-containing protein n=1 Tax=Sporothrix schenckii (strain ATCC 58251 / de Perez 2211183) TaxID=1391915 RepID=U7PZB2_SPOS1|nr:hypothetical protein HMPREF1624_03195 [Sporothrix schenckii ATCC 58251]